jgi:hypothetical protein
VAKCLRNDQCALIRCYYHCIGEKQIFGNERYSSSFLDVHDDSVRHRIYQGIKEVESYITDIYPSLRGDDGIAKTISRNTSQIGNLLFAFFFQ